MVRWHAMAWYDHSPMWLIKSNFWPWHRGTMAHPFPIQAARQLSIHAPVLSGRRFGTARSCNRKGRQIYDWWLGQMPKGQSCELWFLLELIWLVVQSPMSQKSTGILFPIFCFSSGWKRLPEIEPPKRLVGNSFNSWLYSGDYVDLNNFKGFHRLTTTLGNTKPHRLLAFGIKKGQWWDTNCDFWKLGKIGMEWNG